VSIVANLLLPHWAGRAISDGVKPASEICKISLKLKSPRAWELILATQPPYLAIAPRWGAGRSISCINELKSGDQNEDNFKLYHYPKKGLAFERAIVHTLCKED